MKQMPFRLIAAGLLVLAAAPTAGCAAPAPDGAAAELARSAGIEQAGALPFPEDALTARRLLRGHLYSPAGEEIGDIADLLLRPDGSIEAVIAEIDAFAGAREVMIRLPWSAVQVEDEGKSLSAAIDAGRPEQYRLSPEQDQAPESGRAWRASEVLGERVDLVDRRVFGIVKDLILDPTGKVQAVLVQSDLSPSARSSLSSSAFAQNRQGFDPGAPWYKIPRYADDMAHLKVYPQTTHSKD